jgi:hypothetical protein
MVNASLWCKSTMLHAYNIYKHSPSETKTNVSYTEGSGHVIYFHDKKHCPFSHGRVSNYLLRHMVPTKGKSTPLRWYYVQEFSQSQKTKHDNCTILLRLLWQCNNLHSFWSSMTVITLEETAAGGWKHYAIIQWSSKLHHHEESSNFRDMSSVIC